jgi:hypothetical protein
VAERKLRVMPVVEVPPEEATILIQGDPNEPIGRGGYGDESLLCGSCGRVLIEKVDPGQFKDIFMRCSCGAMNDVNP